MRDGGRAIGLLVRTGKCPTDAETQIDPPPMLVADDLAATVDRIIARQGVIAH